MIFSWQYWKYFPYRPWSSSQTYFFLMILEIFFPMPWCSFLWGPLCRTPWSIRTHAPVINQVNRLLLCCFLFFWESSSVFFGLEVFFWPCRFTLSSVDCDCYLEGVFAFVENFLDGCDGHVAGIVSSGKNYEYLLSHNSEAKKFWIIFLAT